MTTTNKKDMEKHYAQPASDLIPVRLNSDVIVYIKNKSDLSGNHLIRMYGSDGTAIVEKRYKCKEYTPVMLHPDNICNPAETETTDPLNLTKDNHMNTHTPAPWTTRRTDKETVKILGNEPKYAYEGKILIATVHEDETDESNTRLIAAAPDLLEALQAILTAPDYMIGEIARAAIAKATGN